MNSKIETIGMIMIGFLMVEILRSIEIFGSDTRPFTFLILNDEPL